MHPKRDLSDISTEVPDWREWYVARALLFSPACRKWFRECEYGPELFLCPVAKAVVAWSLLEREKVPAPILGLMAYKETPLHISFEDFAFWPLYGYRDDEEPSTEGDELRFQQQCHKHTVDLHAVRGII